MTDSVTVWRLNARRLAKTALSGEGAFQYGGRWNLPRTRIVYCAESRALAAMESLVHVEEIDDLVAVEWQVTAITLPKDAIGTPSGYPPSWRTYPYSLATQNFGTAWVGRKSSVALRVPSAVVPGEFNFLLNPAHASFAGLKVAPPQTFHFDPRPAR